MVNSAPIDLVVQNGNIHGGAARLTAGSLAEIATRGMTEADHLCGNEDIFYPPLTKLEHAMPAYALENSYQGDGLNQTWSHRFRRSGFIGTFQTRRISEARRKVRTSRGAAQRGFLHGLLPPIRLRGSGRSRRLSVVLDLFVPG